MKSTALRHIRLFASLFVVLGQLSSPSATAQETQAEVSFPDRPITLVLGYPPGSGSDSTARLLAESLARTIGQAVIVENRPGAAGRIATTLVSRAKPDGYTLLFGTNSELTAAPSIVKNLPYDPLKSFEPIMLISRSLSMVVARKDLPANNLQELVKLAKSEPGRLNFGSGGYNSIPHLLGEQFNQAAGIDIRHVPYQGAGPMHIALMSGQLDYAWSSPGAALAYVQQAKLKALAIGAPKRMEALPNVPTTTEEGYPGFDNGTWFGLVAPAGTAKLIVEKLNSAVRNALQDPAVQKGMATIYVQPVASQPGEFAIFLASEVKRYQKLTVSLGIEPQ